MISLDLLLLLGTSASLETVVNASPASLSKAERVHTPASAYDRHQTRHTWSVINQAGVKHVAGYLETPKPVQDNWDRQPVWDSAASSRACRSSSCSSNLLTGQ
jgi:hypothetical protein